MRLSPFFKVSGSRVRAREQLDLSDRPTTIASRLPGPVARTASMLSRRRSIKAAILAAAASRIFDPSLLSPCPGSKPFDAISLS
jgi:hypothetical protein